MLQRITDWVFGRGTRLESASQALAVDFGIPKHIASLIIQDTMAALDKLNLHACTGQDILAVMRAAAVEMDQLSTEPMGDEIVSGFSVLEDPHCEIMACYIQGMPTTEIALLMGLTAEEIRRSLARSHATIRMQMPSVR